MRPNRLRAMARLTNRTVGLRRFCLTTNNWTPALSHASTIRLPSSQRVAIGFSVTTCRPACATWIVCAE